MHRVTSKDGTPIAYERQGTGPAVILVGGGLDDGSENAPLAPELATRFAVYNYARRGRGESGDTAYNMADQWPQRWREYSDKLNAALAEGRRGDAVELFTQVADTPDEHIAAARGSQTLVATGGVRSPDAAGWIPALDEAADAIAASLPNGERQTLEGQTHVADPKTLAPVLDRFFAG